MLIVSGPPGVNLKLVGSMSANAAVDLRGIVVGIAAKDHTFLVWSCLGSHRATHRIQNRRSVGMVQAFAFVALVEIEFSVRSECKSVNSVVVLNAFQASENNFFFIKSKSTR